MQNDNKTGSSVQFHGPQCQPKAQQLLLFFFQHRSLYLQITGLIITTLSGGLLVTNWLVREQQMLRDVGFSVFCRFNSKPT